MASGTGMDPNEAVLQIANYSNYTRADVQRWFSRHYRLTGRLPYVYPSTIQAIKTYAKVPNEPFREPYERVFTPLILGDPIPGEQGNGDPLYESDFLFYDRFRDELDDIRAQHPHTLIGPSKTDNTEISNYLRDALGLRVRQDGRDKLTVAWLLQYEVAVVLCKTLGLRPFDVGI